MSIKSSVNNYYPIVLQLYINIVNPMMHACIQTTDILGKQVVGNFKTYFLSPHK